MGEGGTPASNAGLIYPHLTGRLRKKKILKPSPTSLSHPFHSLFHFVSLGRSFFLISSLLPFSFLSVTKTLPLKRNRNRNPPYISSNRNPIRSLFFFSDHGLHGRSKRAREALQLSGLVQGHTRSRFSPLPIMLHSRHLVILLPFVPPCVDIDLV